MDRHRRKHALLALASCWLVTVDAPAQAQQSANVTLRWSDDGSCPDDGATLAEARSLAGPEANAQQLRRFEVSVRALGSGALRVDLAADGDGQQVRRTLELPDCEQARRASALLIALALNPNAALPMPEPAPGSAGAAAAQPSTAAQVQPQSSTEAQSSEARASEARASEARASEPPPPSDDGRGLPRTTVVELGVRALLMASTLPQPAPGIGLVGAVDWGGSLRTRLQLAVDYLPAQDRALPEAGKRISIGLLRATATGCQLWAPAQALALGPCLGLSLGRIAGESRGVASPGTDAALWVAPEVGGHVGLWSGPIALRLSAFASLPLRRPRFSVASVGQVFEVPPVGFWAGLEILLRI